MKEGTRNDTIRYDAKRHVIYHSPRILDSGYHIPIGTVTSLSTDRSPFMNTLPEVKEDRGISWVVVGV